MNRLFFTITALLVFSASAEAQQRFRRTSFPLNSFVVNPAVAGTESYTVFGSSYRSQWAGFEGSPTTMLLSGHTSVYESLGAGLLIYRDDMGGAVSQTGFEVTGSYQLVLPNTDMFSFGLSLQGTQFGFDSRDFTVWQQNDPALSGTFETSFGIDAAVGFLLYGENYNVGLSVFNLLQDELSLQSVDTTDNKLIRNYRITGSYLYEIDRQFSIQGSGMIKLTELGLEFASLMPQIDIYTRGIYSPRRSASQFWGGLGYRIQDAVNISLGMIYQGIGFGYSYDFTTNGNLLGRHSHEINLTYYLPNRSYGKGYKKVLDRGRIVK
tara:strand:+ start:3369 stop:4337 length:969 start_codon:yes stop_codon:yes gene_type:complete